MNLGNAILASPERMLLNEKDLFSLLVHDLNNLAVPSYDKRINMSDIIYEQTDCGAGIQFDQMGFNITCIIEGSCVEFNERFDYPFSSHGLGEYLCDLESRVEDAFQDKNQG